MILAIVGPTCSGKSMLAIKLAKYFNAKIINADPYSCYKELNIGVAKPSFDELNKVKHNLINIVSVSERFTIYDYQIKFRECINNLIKENKNVIIVGGSGLYLRSAIYDYEFKESNNEDYSFINDLSNEDIYNKLKEIDPQSLEKIHINNRKRLIRAYQIFLESGQTKSSIENKQIHKSIYDVKIIGINPNREELYKNINDRVDRMFAEGLIDEVNGLFNKFNKELQAFQAIGYKEFTQSNDINEIKELIKKNTRNYAKRQLTFFKHQFENIIWYEDINEAYKELTK